ncbi:MAG: hypothetical protein M1829_005068 [Trizodia sp. TS-e1964]|nr:MAG: hypothetical protein M1829_005068 [Trizodia sp. TS-e1964]
METDSHSLERTGSHQSSTKSQRSEMPRAKPRKQNSNTSSRAVTPSHKELTSFPSLPLHSSPQAERRQKTSTSPTPGGASRTSSANSKPPANSQQSSMKEFSTLQKTALFGDLPLSNSAVVGSLHLTSDEHIERLVARNGAVAMVRQLAEDLALRDAQLSGLRRRAEERERTLRKMLLDCGMSNLDLESRLRALEGLANSGGASSGSKDARHASGEEVKASSRSIDDMMCQAMSDTVGLEGTALGKGLGLVEDNDSNTHPSAPYALAFGDDDTRSMDSTVSEVLPKGKARAWKDFLWGGGGGASLKSSRASSVTSELNEEPENNMTLRISSAAAPQRRGLSNGLFQPPEHRDIRTLSQPSVFQGDTERREDVDSDSQSRKSSTSFGALALKFVAGNSHGGRDNDNTRALRGRAATVPEGFSQSEAASKPPSSALQKLSKVAAQASLANAKRRPPALLSLGYKGTVKASKGSRAQTSSPSSLTPTDNVINSGPVEMDAILPLESRPPTLLHTYSNYNGQGYLTDRFGFIYDQRRKRRQKEAMKNAQVAADQLVALSPEIVGNETIKIRSANANLASESASVDSQPVEGHKTVPAPLQGWQDFLKIATFPTELLSHTPPADPILVIESSEEDPPLKTSHIKVAHRGSLPAASFNPKPITSPVVSSNALFAMPSTANASSPSLVSLDQAEPVKLLLEQLTELHDSLQRDRTVKWNEFLRKVRAERKREGEAAATADKRSVKTMMPETLLTEGEVIGVAGLGNKGKIGRAKWNEFYSLVLGGIPVTYRAKIWAECCGATALKVPGYYDDLTNSPIDDESIKSQITMDITRTLTDNIFFRKGPGVAKLNEVLLAYAKRNPEVGYCQGMNMIAASLLLIMATAEDAFWILASMIENILPENYYGHSLLTSRADQKVLRQYVSDILPNLSLHLDDLGIELEALTFQWFLSVFTDCLSAEALFRVWDVVLCTHDGSTFLFQVALALLTLNERQLLNCTTPAGVYSYINHQMTNHAISIDGLIQASEALKKVVKRSEIEERRQLAVESELAATAQRARGGRNRATSQALEQPLNTGLEQEEASQETLTESQASDVNILKNS